MTYSLLHIRMTGVAPLIMRAAVLADPLHPLSRKLSEITRKKLKTDADFERIAQIEWYGSLWAEHGRCDCSRGWQKGLRWGSDYESTYEWRSRRVTA